MAKVEKTEPLPAEFISMIKALDRETKISVVGFLMANHLVQMPIKLKLAIFYNRWRMVVRMQPIL